MPIHVKIKLWLKQLLPKKLFESILKIWRATLAPLFTHNPDRKYLKQFISRHNLTIIDGPFVGMKYIDQSSGSVLLHKLAGYYESILHPTIETIKTESYDTIIDIGCAEGYYLVGLGKALPNSTLYGYDMDETALARMKKLAEINNLKNQLIADPICVPEKLTKQITDDTLLICDAEGFEEEVLDPKNSPALLNVKKMIVETHEFAAPNVIETLKKRFSESHDIDEITFKMADPQKYSFLRSISNQKDLYYLLRERGEQEQVWLVMTRK